MHPLLPQLELVEYCRLKSIVLTAYAPLGKCNPQILTHPIVTRIAERYQCAPTQVLLGWLTGKGVVVVPKTRSLERMKENMLVRFLA